jgi:TonB family protein
MTHGPFIPLARPRESRRFAIPLFGIVTSLLLHALLLAPIVFGASTRARRPIDNPMSSIGVGSSDKSTMTLVSIDQSGSDAKSVQEIKDLASPVASALLPVAKPDFALPAALMEADGADNTEPSDDATEANHGEHARLLGMYVGQIDARIQRAWIRPRTPVGSVMFSCRVRITQDENGRVQEMEVVRCNGDAAWETSLVRAIQSASPLPAPPDPKVFSQTLTLDFTAHPFSPGDTEGFEPARSARAR